MKIIDIINNSKKPLFTYEIVPPLKGASLDKIVDTVETLREYNPSYINITNHQSEVVYRELDNGLIKRSFVHKRPGTVALSAMLQFRYNIPVASHIICGGTSSEEIETMLIELNFLGIDNVLALRGDAPSGEKRFKQHPDGWANSSSLVSQINDMNKGIYLDKELKNPSKTNFCVGVAGYPEKHAEAANMESDLDWLKFKVDCGASYIVTQMFFDNSSYFSFVKKCRHKGINCPIIPGIKPIGTIRDLKTIPQTFHVDIPLELETHIRKAKDTKEIREIGIWWAKKQTIDLLKHQVPGVHYYTLGKADSIARIVKETF